MRNPLDKELIKWIHKLIPEYMPIVHDKENKRFTLDINGEQAKVEYVYKDGKLFLVHSEVPRSLKRTRSWENISGENI